MDLHSKRLLVFAVLVSFIFNSNAYNAAASTEEDTSTDHIQNKSNCDPVTHVCGVPEPDPNPTTAAVTEEDSQDTTELEPSTGHDERVCIPGTTVCKNPSPNPKPTKEAVTVTDEDASESDSVSNSIKTDSLIPEIICKKPTDDGCHGPHPDSVISKPTDGDLPEQGNSNIEPNINNPSNELVCDSDPITHRCGGPKPQLVVSDQYGKAAKIEDTVIQEQEGPNGIYNFACTTNPDGTRTCRGAHHASDFGIAQPRDVSA